MDADLRPPLTAGHRTADGFGLFLAPRRFSDAEIVAWCAAAGDRGTPSDYRRVAVAGKRAI